MEKRLPDDTRALSASDQNRVIDMILTLAFDPPAYVVGAHTVVHVNGRRFVVRVEEG